MSSDRGMRFLGKVLPDGRGARLNLDGTFIGENDYGKFRTCHPTFISCATTRFI